MAVTKFMESRSMQRKEKVGTDEMGKELYKSRTISNIDKSMTDADFLQFNNLIDPLIDSFGYMLYEKISNSLTEV